MKTGFKNRKMWKPVLKIKIETEKNEKPKTKMYHFGF